ncbi:uncharacterized protein [Haliotis cracherodii]|uniref:uncharacterized protein n=1 Tax=Haliotis cracherodii TaxID=6455 RepID=UPI0039EA092B
MAVHIFGAVSSPSISNFALKHTASKAEEKYGILIAETIRKNFYVDDCLKAAKDEDTAVSLVQDLVSACADGGFRLTKFTSNSRNLLKSIPTDDHSKELQSRDLDYDDVPIERALGMRWYVNSDMFGFSVELPDKPVTRRGILSTVSSFYDPLGMVFSVILPAKKILQDLCTDQSLDWDDDIPSAPACEWKKWLSELDLMKTLNIPWCVKPFDFGEVTSAQLHVFSDASTRGYGCVVYLRLCDKSENIHVAFLMDNVSYYTYSTTVIHYINSEKKRFPVFVANRVRLIRDFSSPDQWKYIDTYDNPADVASRGTTTAKLLQDDKWFKGPVFLRTPETEWTIKQLLTDCDEQCEETVQSCVTQAQICESGMDCLINHYSNWYRLKRAVAVYSCVMDILQERMKCQLEKHVPDCQTTEVFTVKRLEHASKAVVKYVQSKTFSCEINSLQDSSGKRGRVPRSSSVSKLDPFIDSDGVLRVGGRLNKAQVPESMKHQILLPRKNHVTTLIIRDVHHKLSHAGRNHVLSVLRETFWVVSANSTVRNVLHQCVTCRRLTAPTCEQKMADLPPSRTSPGPPFTFTGVDYFGPFIIKEGRKQVKRYGVLFTCLVSRAELS